MQLLVECTVGYDEGMCSLSYWWNVQSAMLVVMVVMEGHGRSWKAMEGHGRSRKVKEGHGWSFPITGLRFQVRKVIGCGGGL